MHSVSCWRNKLTVLYALQVLCAVSCKCRIQTCVLTFILVAKVPPHCGQPMALSPVWTLMCILSLEGGRSLVYISQLNEIQSCRLNYLMAGVLACSSQSSHRQPGPWFSLPPWLKELAQQLFQEIYVLLQKVCLK